MTTKEPHWRHLLLDQEDAGQVINKNSGRWAGHKQKQKTLGRSQTTTEDAGQALMHHMSHDCGSTGQGQVPADSQLWAVHHPGLE